MSAVTRNRVEVMHGVNLDMLGSRDHDIYGDFTLPELEVRIKRFARDLDLEASFFQTNSEGEFVEHLHRLPERADAALINAGAWTHYSWAIRDALDLTGIPTRRGAHLRHLQARGVAPALRLRGAGRCSSARSTARARMATGRPWS